MYKETYGFSEDPFNLKPDPKFLYLSHSHWEALSSMISGIDERKGIMVITGEAGVGKTILIYALLRDMGEKIKNAFIFNPRLDFKAMLENILRDLQVPFREKEENILSLVVQFRKYLRERLAQDDIVVIVIDEAQSLDEEVLEALFGLSSPASPTAKVLQILLVGHLDLEVKLDSDKLRPFKKRIASHRRIRPLMQEEAKAYLRHRLKAVGPDLSEIFTPEAVNRMWEFAGGIPRVMNLLCDRALSIGDHTSSPIIDARVIKKAIKELSYLQPGRLKAIRPKLPSKKSLRKVFRILFFIFSLCVCSFALTKLLSLLLHK